MSEILSNRDFIISDVSITESAPNLYTESSNFTANARSRGLHRIGFKLSVYLQTHDDVRRFRAFWLNARGRLNPFVLDLTPTEGNDWYNPIYYSSRNVALANPLGVGANTMILSGISSPIPAGTLFQFSNDSKLYTLLADAKANQPVEFFPGCRFAQQAGVGIITDCKPVVRMEEDKYELNLQPGSAVKLSMQENI
ncbi:hypothetical protein [Aeromonas salmonicida]|uniref:hypothetical protein n=1 Tax=Aeromonas salmonicida TaxID=645 RepID=UPI003D31F5F5